MSRGKKIGPIRIYLDRKADESKSYGCITRNDKSDWVDVDLRFSTSTGLFNAQFDGVWYSAKTQDELKEKIKQVADVKVDLVWKRYILVEYHADAECPGGHGGTGRRGSTHLDLDRGQDERWSRIEREHTVITGIHLGWNIFELSEPYKLPGKKVIRSIRDFDTETREAGPQRQQDDDEIPAHTVEWTEEREAFLVHVREALTKLDNKLVELFSGDMEQLAKKLDAAVHFSADRMLEAPKPRKR